MHCCTALHHTALLWMALSLKSKCGIKEQIDIYPGARLIEMVGLGCCGGLRGWLAAAQKGRWITYHLSIAIPITKRRARELDWAIRVPAWKRGAKNLRIYCILLSVPFKLLLLQTNFSSPSRPRRTVVLTHQPATMHHRSQTALGSPLPAPPTTLYMP